jgi:ribosomal protein S17E
MAAIMRKTEKQKSGLSKRLRNVIASGITRPGP